MTFPVVQSTTTGTTASGTSHVLNLPSGVVSGDLILFVVGCAGGTTVGFTSSGYAPARSNPGLTAVADSTSANSRYIWRRADGTEGSTATFTSTSSISTAYHAYRISGAGLPAFTASAVTSSANTDPAPHTSPSGSQDHLWITNRISTSNSATASPTGYSALLSAANGTAVSLDSAYRTATGSVENPGPFTSPSGVLCAAGVLSIPPSGLAQLAQIVTGTVTAATTTHNITVMPDGVLAGDLLVVAFSNSGGATASTTSTGWSAVAATTVDGTSVIGGTVFYKTATGTDSLTVTTSASCTSSWVAGRILNASSPPAGGAASGSSTNSDPPSYTAATSATYLWLATRHGAGAIGISAAPTGYGETANFTGLSGTSSTALAAHLVPTAATENPGTFTSASAAWVAWTVAVPIASGTTTGTAAAALGALTASASGHRVLAGTATSSLGSLTASAAGHRVLTGTAAAPLGGLTGAASGTPRVTGTATAALGGLAGAASGTVAGAPLVTGTATAPLGGLTASASGTRTATGTAAAGLGVLAGAAAGDRTATGAATSSLGGLGANATGAPLVTGTATAPLGGLTATSTGAPVLAGTATAPLGGLVAAAAGSATDHGASAATLGALAAFAAGVRATLGAATADLGALGGAAAGGVVTSGSGAASLGRLGGKAYGTTHLTVYPLTAGTATRPAQLTAGTATRPLQYTAGTATRPAQLTAGTATRT